MNITGNITYQQSQVGSIANHDTDALAEGVTNLYFTDERVDDRVAALIDGGTGISATYNDAGNLLTLSADFGEFTTTDITEGTNLYYTDARADARVVAGITGKLDASAVSTFGGTLIDDADAAAARTTLGLGTAATTAAADYATAAQGALADSATQPGDLATVATTGSYNDLSNLPTLFSGAYADLTGKPTLGTAAATDSTAYATAAQGTQADTNDTDIDDLYTALNAIGNDASITNMTQLKAALAALTR